MEPSHANLAKVEHIERPVNDGSIAFGVPSHDNVQKKHVFVSDKDNDALGEDASGAMKELGETAPDLQQQYNLTPTTLLPYPTFTSPSQPPVSRESNMSKPPAQQQTATGPPESEIKPKHDATQAVTAEGEAELTPEKRRLQVFKTKEAALSRTLAHLSHQRSVLLLQLTSALPLQVTRGLCVTLPDEEDYMPSTLAHTIPALPEIESEDNDTLMKEANSLVKHHINLLHEYNEIKDVAQGLIGMIADQRGVRVVDCQVDFGIGPND